MPQMAPTYWVILLLLIQTIFLMGKMGLYFLLVSSLAEGQGVKSHKSLVNQDFLLFD
uniref:ATP synthase subunit 8 n=1 Tax=Polyplax asiatica TaxID=1425297 RepID=V9PXI7_9NEOP|nr:ATP synthase subunit 8 [Polyplax asiatica]